MAHHDEQKVKHSACQIIWTYKLEFWIFVLWIFLTSITYLPFFQNISMLLRYNFGFTLKQSGVVIAISAASSTIFGILVSHFVTDRFEKRGWSCSAANLITGSSYIWILFISPATKNLVVLAPLFLHQFGFSLFMSNLWPALHILIKKLHPDMSEDDEEDENGRMGIAIGLCSSAINASTSCASFIIGYWLDAVVTAEVRETSFITMTSYLQTYVHQSEPDYAAAMRRSIVFFLSIDFVAAFLLIV